MAMDGMPWSFSTGNRVAIVPQSYYDVCEGLTWEDFQRPNQLDYALIAGKTSQRKNFEYKKLCEKVLYLYL